MPREFTYITADNNYPSLLQQAGFSPEFIFSSDQIKPWRILPDRQNCTWEIPAGANSTIRLHVKRYLNDSAASEARGYRFLESARIPTAPLVAWGRLPGRRGFLITEDSKNHQPADKLIVSPETFQPLLFPTADLVARLHNARLHHRDLYLCHFFAGDPAGPLDLRLIDAARVRPLPLLFRQRWIIKDLAQFWYSTLALPITDPQRSDWLQRYAAQRRIQSIHPLQKSIERKSNWIRAHDMSLRKKQPTRNISIPNNEPAA